MGLLSHGEAVDVACDTVPDPVISCPVNWIRLLLWASVDIVSVYVVTGIVSKGVYVGCCDIASNLCWQQLFRMAQDKILDIRTRRCPLCFFNFQISCAR